MFKESGISQKSDAIPGGFSD